MNANEESVAPAVRSILSAARERSVDADRVSVDARSLADAFAAADADGRVPVIAEVKPTSPTTDGRREADPVELAEAMVEGGAAAVSVLTEPEHFGGSVESLRRIRAAVDAPVLRKDFLLEEAQLDAVAADLVLVIARFVDDLAGLVAAAEDRGFRALVEVHDRTELREAVAADASVIGVNNRDLSQLAVDLGTFETVAPAAPDDVTLVAESGVTDAADARQMRAAGADGLLIGSAIMAYDDGDATGTAADPLDAVRANTQRFTRAESNPETEP